tara:strand:+ start:572 stop:811 length:240 start_codon:yes stop_codon:yes gene_type:complete
MDKDISDKINSLEQKIITLETKIDLILTMLNDKVEPNCSKMSNHIDFIDKVYDNVKNPLGYICSFVSSKNTNNYSLTNS